MINKIPTSWQYTADMENLFLFYQASEEMLSFSSPDSYRLTVHNAITLCLEAKKIYSILKSSNQIETYYKQYIPPIIEELIHSIQQDSVIKAELGMRLDSITTGLTTAIDNHTLLVRWLNLIMKSCSFEKYIEQCKNIIIECVITGTNQKKLLYYTNNYYVSLINTGYNPEYLYQSVIRFFDNRYNKIQDKEQIKDFLLDKLQPSLTEYELYLVADTYLIDTFIDINPGFKSFISTSKLDEAAIKADIDKSRVLRTFYENYCAHQRDSISMISYKAKALDPYSALEEVESYFNLLQIFTGYFKHKSEQKLYFDVIQKLGNRYHPIKLRKIIPNRPYTEEDIINRRISKILESGSISDITMHSILSALSMHLDAINCRNDETMLRTFWTATEALFFDPSASGEREAPTYALSHILDKTYLLKVLRTIFAQIKDYIPKEDLEGLGVDSFLHFLEFFSEYEPDSAEFKKLTSLLGYHPLLRSRVYNLRKELSDSKHIREKLVLHNKRVLWQILRIYRTRNLSTHAGITMPYIKDILFNLHNYFDYVINYIICKIENDEYINNISTIVFEARTDNQIYMEQLKEKQTLKKENCLALLFGPDKDMILYEFEVNTAE